jgi:hypothetical protein
MSEVPGDGMNRRDVLKRGAMVGGALVWTVPVVQSIAGPALAAQGSEAPELCAFTLIVSVDGGTTGCVRVTGATQECCNALNAANVLPDPVARFDALLDALAGPCSGAFTRSNCVV